VLGPQAEWRLPELLWQVLAERRRVFSVDDEHGRIAEGLPVRRDGTVRAWVSIMYGCNNFCSYCIVPYVRGRERSRDPEKIVAECRELIEAGYREIYLLGQNVNSYGNDLDAGWDFADLLSAVDAIPGDYWLRFMSSQPKDATEKLFETMARCSHVAKNLHLPVQSGCDRVLRAMHRPYTRQGYLDLIAAARRAMPGLVLTSDVIIGFPGETEEEAMETVSLVREVGFDALFTFIFSPRPGTPAAEMDDPVPRAEKQRWFDRLLAVQNAFSAEKHAAYVGSTLRVLVDGESDDAEFPLSARTEGNRLVRLKGERGRIGSFAEARITDSNTWALYGELL
jgi:tRNA-2-methylthio-N6-dimethylallyladenosine synthase